MTGSSLLAAPVAVQPPRSPAETGRLRVDAVSSAFSRSSALSPVARLSQSTDEGRPDLTGCGSCSPRGFSATLREADDVPQPLLRALYPGAPVSLQVEATIAFLNQRWFRCPRSRKMTHSSSSSSSSCSSAPSSSSSAPSSSSSAPSSSSSAPSSSSSAPSPSFSSSSVSSPSCDASCGGETAQESCAARACDSRGQGDEGTLSEEAARQTLEETAATETLENILTAVAYGLLDLPRWPQREQQLILRCFLPRSKAEERERGEGEEGEEGEGEEEEGTEGGVFGALTIFSAFHRFLSGWPREAESPAFLVSCRAALEQRRDEREKAVDGDATIRFYHPSWRSWTVVLHLLEVFVSAPSTLPSLLSCLSPSASPAPGSSCSSSSSRSFSCSRGVPACPAETVEFLTLLSLPSLVEAALCALPGGPVAFSCLLPASLSSSACSSRLATALLTAWGRLAAFGREPRECRDGNRETETTQRAETAAGGPRISRAEWQREEEGEPKREESDGYRQKAGNAEMKCGDVHAEDPFFENVPEALLAATRRFLLRGHAASLARAFLVALLSQDAAREETGRGESWKQQQQKGTARAEGAGETRDGGESKGAERKEEICCVAEFLAGAVSREDPGGPASHALLSACLRELEPLFFLSASHASSPVVSDFHGDGPRLSLHSLAAPRLLQSLLRGFCRLSPCSSSRRGLDSGFLSQFLFKALDPSSSHLLPLPIALFLLDFLSGSFHCSPPLPSSPCSSSSSSLSSSSCSSSVCGRAAEVEGGATEVASELVFSPLFALSFVDLLQLFLHLWANGDGALVSLSLHQHLLLTCFLSRSLSNLTHLQRRLASLSSSSSPSLSGWIPSVLEAPSLELLKRRLHAFSARKKFAALMRGIHARLGSSEEALRLLGMLAAEKMARETLLRVTGKRGETNGREARRLEGKDSDRETALEFRELRDPTVLSRHPALLFVAATERRGWTRHPRSELEFEGDERDKQGKEAGNDVSGERARPKEGGGEKSDPELERFLIGETTEELHRLHEISYLLHAQKKRQQASSFLDSLAFLDQLRGPRDGISSVCYKEENRNCERSVSLPSSSSPSSSPASSSSFSPSSSSSSSTSSAVVAEERQVASRALAPEDKKVVHSIRVVSVDEDTDSDDEDDRYFQTLPDLPAFDASPPSPSPSSPLPSSSFPAASRFVLPVAPAGSPHLPQSVRQVVEWLGGEIHTADESSAAASRDPCSHSSGTNELPSRRLFRVSAALHCCPLLLLLQAKADSAATLFTLTHGGMEKERLSSCFSWEFRDPLLAPRLLRLLLSVDTGVGTQPTELERMRQTSLAALLALQLEPLLPLLAATLLDSQASQHQKLLLLEALQRAASWLAAGAPRRWTLLSPAENGEETEGEERGPCLRHDKLTDAFGACEGEESGWDWRGPEPGERSRRFAHAPQRAQVAINLFMPHASSVCTALLALLERPMYPATDFAAQQNFAERAAAHRRLLSQPPVVASLLHTAGVSVQLAGYGSLDAEILATTGLRAAIAFQSHRDRSVRRGALSLLAAVAAAAKSLDALFAAVEDAERALGCPYTPEAAAAACGGRQVATGDLEREGSLPDFWQQEGEEDLCEDAEEDSAGFLLREKQVYVVGGASQGGQSVVERLKDQMQNDPDEVCRRLAALVLSLWLELPG
ncbi:hypothetical protein TGPRC2_220920 [Toxoplasma gondii TgCatPRC2]|uniref:Uncharacterized protein n=1 Tax=Toxoplasma gondii TgCatPRC2 TaxID=1130821 RepID=A0A151GZ37_TOXGO|nr:hypothetical protein TGPRC2_220920 [Toxoplasma gondii TgCatPRC2]